MQLVIRPLLVFVAVTLVLPGSGVASVVFQPGKKAKYVAPARKK